MLLLCLFLKSIVLPESVLLIGLLILYYWQSEFAYSFDHPSCKYFATITYLTRVVYCLDMADSPCTDLIIEAQLCI